MKNAKNLRKAIAGIALTLMICLLVACDKENIPGGKHDPVWTYDTGEDPYGSKPWIIGNRLVVCSHSAEEDHGTVHCLNLVDGSSAWKMTDSTVVCNNPVVYNNLVIYGGYNVHALNLADGSHAWDYQDDPIHFMLYSSPELEAGYVYLGSTFTLVKLNADNGSLVWENTENPYQNISLAAPLFHSGKIFYGNSLGMASALNAATGSVEWSAQFESGISNRPLSDGTRIFIGIHEMNNTANSLFCYPMNTAIPQWSAKLWQITSNMAISANKLYLTGGSTFYCLEASTGVQQWTYAMPAGSVAEPVIHNGKVYTGNGDQLVCLDSSSGKAEWTYSVGGHGFSSPAISGDRLYVACGDGKIYCFEI